MKTCPHCKETFVFEKPKQFGAHVVNCKDNPKREDRIKKCSAHFKGLKRKKCNCEICGKSISVNNMKSHLRACEKNKNKLAIKNEWKINNLESKCPHCDKIFKTNGICAHIFSMHTEEGIRHKKEMYTEEAKYKMGWLRGLSKETDERVYKISENLKKQYADGTLIPSFKDKNHSVKTLELLSKNQSVFLEETGTSGFPRVKWYRAKNILNEEFVLRGTWEVKTSDFLNKHNIIWIRKIYIKYNKYGVVKTYTPDFYLPEFDLYIEVKGYFSKKDKEKIQLVQQQNNIIINLLFGVAIKKMEVTESFLEFKKLFSKI